MYVFGYRYLDDVDADQREILNDGIHRSRTGHLPFGNTPLGPKNPTFDREYLENDK